MALISPVSAKKSMEIAKLANLPSTVDIDVEIIGGQSFIHSHVGFWAHPSYFVGARLGGVEKRTAESNKGERHPVWKESFVFAADLSTRLVIKIYCKHHHVADNHVIGEAILDLLETPRNQEYKIDIYDPTKKTAKVVRGQLIIYLQVSWPAVFSLPDELLSVVNLEGTSEDLIKPLLVEERLSPTWLQFLSVFHSVVSQTAKFLDFHQPSQVAIAAVAFAAKVVIDQVKRDERIEDLVGIMRDLYFYFLDAVTIPNIFTYERVMQRLLGQTYECAYFIRDYKTIDNFAQRAVTHMANSTDDIIIRFKIAFGELKIDLVMGSSLQTAVVGFRILQKVENIENLLYINYLSCSKSASWDSGRACLHGTHRDVISDIISWTTDVTDNRQSRLYLLRGPPGCGKSSIAHSIAHIFDQQHRLGAAVFPDRCIDQKTMNSQTVCSTIAYQLAGYNTKIRQRMAEIIRVNPSLASANIERQLPELIATGTEGLAIVGPIVIVVDGLNDPKEQSRLLTAINQFSVSLPINFRVLLTSRPGNKLADTLQSGEIWSVRDLYFDDMGDGTLDIGKYMNQCLSQLHSVKPNLFQNYPQVDDLSKLLVPMAFGMHYWVTTVYRLLLSSCDGNDSSILAEILSNIDWHPASPVEAMDHIYIAVLRVLHNISLPVPAKDICHLLIHSLPTFSPLSAPSPKFRSVPSKSSKTPLKILGELGGIIEFGHDPQGLPLIRLQPSFEGFIVDPQRSSMAGFNVNLQHPLVRSLAELCLDEMNHTLTHNLCQLDDLMVLDEEIPDREDRIHQYIPTTLQYACCQWISHLDLLPPDIDKTSPVVLKIQEFLFSHLLHWFEVMSILGHVRVILPSLERLAAWFKKHYDIVDPKCHIMIMDGIRFINAFFPIISKAAMQTYISALPLMGSDTLLFKTYQTETTTCRSDLQSHSPSGWVPLKVPAKWDTDRHPKAIISSSALSGYLIAEAECHPTTKVRFYDSRTGREAEKSLTLRVPAESIHFSPDNQHILAIDKHGTISIWDIKKGSFVHDIESKLDYPLIQLSANGSKIIIGGRKPNGFLDDFSIWNTATAQCIQTFVLNISYWHSIALSPDGMTLAVQEVNKTGIQFFDVQRGRPGAQPFVMEGNAAQETFKNIIWSSDGNFLATVSIQDTIRLWDIDKGTCMPLDSEERDGSLSPDLSFSPDNSCIAAWYSYSKSHNSYARIWDTQTRTIIWSGALGSTREYSMSFLDDSQEILFFELNHPPIRIVRLPTYMSDPLRIHEWTSDYYIQYSHLTSTAGFDFASTVDRVGWITSKAGERLMWIPYPDFELHSKDRTESDGQQARFSHRKTLEVKKPETNTVVLRFKIDFEFEE